MTMAVDKQDKVLNVPILRFPEFKDEWEICKVGDYGKIITGSTPPTSDNTNYAVGTHLWASPVDLGQTKFVTDTQTKLSSIGFSKTRKLPIGSVLVTCIGSTIGKMGMAATEMSTNQQINSIVVDSQYDNHFVYYALQSRFPRYLTSVAVQAVPIMSKSSFEKLQNYRTTFKEQKKIGTLLNLIDERISTQNRIIEDLKREKKYLLEQLFCLPNERVPKLRLKGMTSDWQKVKLCDIAERVTERNKANTCNRVLTIAAQYGLIDQQEFFNKQIASSDLTNYYLLRKGDFAYNKSYSGDYSWGAVKRLDKYDEGVLSSLYICLRPNEDVDSDFLCHYFESTKWYRGISEISGEGARNHGLLNMSVDDYFNTLHRIPTKQEQIIVADLLNAVTRKIDIETKLLENLQKQKSFLLKEMFI